MRFRLYCGIVRNGTWYNHTEVIPLEGGVLAMLEGGERTGAARLLNLMKGSIKSLYTEDGQEHEMMPDDYLDLKVADTWKIGYEAIKLKTGEAHPIIPESFFCKRCSTTYNEKYTDVKESWQKLIDDGLIDEIYLDSPEFTFEVELPDPIEIEASRTIMGGNFDTVTMKHMTLGDMLMLHRNQEAQESQANSIYATWDAMLVGVKGLSEKDFNIIKRIPGKSFSRKYFSTDANQEAISDAIDNNVVGWDDRDRVVYCRHCGNAIWGGLDVTNFFSPLLPKKSNRRS